MKALNQKAQSIMNKLTQDMESTNSYAKFDNSNGAFMPVTVEKVGSIFEGPLFSVCHYYEQNGDLMRDPEIVFLKGFDNRYYPMDYRQDGLGIDQHPVIIGEDDRKIKGYYSNEQADITKFANIWMKNIQAQQKL